MLASDLEQVIGSKAYTPEGDKVGNVYLDDSSGEPTFVSIETGLFGTRESFAPVRDARLTDDGLVLPYDKDTVKDAPNIDADEHMSPEEERELFDYYGIPFVEQPEPVEEPRRVRLPKYVVTDAR